LTTIISNYYTLVLSRTFEYKYIELTFKMLAKRLRDTLYYSRCLIILVSTFIRQSNKPAVLRLSLYTLLLSFIKRPGWQRLSPPRGASWEPLEMISLESRAELKRRAIHLWIAWVAVCGKNALY
jgi:hypothetical protein